MDLDAQRSPTLKAPLHCLHLNPLGGELRPSTLHRNVRPLPAALLHGCYLLFNEECHLSSLRLKTGAFAVVGCFTATAELKLSVGMEVYFS